LAGKDKVAINRPRLTLHKIAHRSKKRYQQ